MFALLALVFLVVPFLELFVLIQVGDAVGAIPTIAVLVVVSVAGAWLVKREGLGVLRRGQQAMRGGTMPGVEIVDGALILFAGALLLTPGFLTDLLGLSLLVPHVRRLVRTFATRRLVRRARVSRAGQW